MMGFLSDAKDRLVESVAPAFLNTSVLKPYGRIVTLKLNSKQKRMDADLELKGERELVRAQVDQYELIQEEGRLFLSIQAISTSREWLTELAVHFLVGRRILVPPEAAKFLSRLL